MKSFFSVFAVAFLMFAANSHAFCMKNYLKSLNRFSTNTAFIPKSAVPGAGPATNANQVSARK